MIAPSSPKRTKVFISYSHKDVRFLERLRVHLNGNKNLEVWSDQDIRPGQIWREKINQALDVTKVAVLLVSADFMNSSFIKEVELPQLLSAMKGQNVTILPVLLSPCHYENTPLNNFQFVNPKPLRSQVGQPKQEEIWVKVKKAIEEALNITSSNSSEHTINDDIKSSTASIKKRLSLAERYREALLHDQRMTQIQVLGMSHPLPISEIYVRLSINERILSDYHTTLNQPFGRDSQAWVRKHKWRYQERFNLSMIPEEALYKYPHSIVLGGPGTGKTTLLKYLALRILQDATQSVDFPTIPIYISLHEFANSSFDNLLKFAAYMWSKWYKYKNISQEESYAYISQQIDHGNALILLDGLDETAIGENIEQAKATRARVSEEIINLANRCQWIVVTARSGSYQANHLHAFTTLEMLELREQEISQFIDNWFSQHLSEDNHGRASGLKEELKKNQSIQALATNPLLLTLITITYEENQELSYTRTGLYEACIDLLLQKWDINRSRRHIRNIDIDKQKKLLQDVAWHMHKENQSTISKKDLLSIVSNFLVRFEMSSWLAEDLLHFIISDNGLLLQLHEEVYKFLHIEFQEYFCAQYVHATHQDTILLEYLLNPWWENVILLYVERHEVTRLVEYLLIDQEIPKDLFLTQLILAGHCLATRPELPERLHQHIINLLFDALLHNEFTLTQQQIAETLTSIGNAYPDGDVIQRLLDIVIDQNQGQELAIRCLVAEALGNQGIRRLAPILLDLLIEVISNVNSDTAALVSGIFNALSKLTDSALLPRLQQILFNMNMNWPITFYAARLIEQAGDSLTAWQLFSLFSQQKAGNVRGALAASLVTIGDETLLSKLLVMITTSEIEAQVAEDMLFAMSKRRHLPSHPRLITLLDMPQINVKVRSEIALTIGLINDETDVESIHRIADLLSNTMLELEIRTNCGETLVRMGLYKHRKLVLSKLADITLNISIRCSIATTLADMSASLMKHDIRDLTISLRTIYKNEQSEEVRESITLVLGLLDDPTVYERLHTMVLNQSFSEKLRSRVAEKIVQHTTSIEQILGALKEQRDQKHIKSAIKLVKAVAINGRIDLVPELLLLLADTSLPQDLLISIAEVIATLGEQKESLESLLTHWQHYHTSDNYANVTDMIYRAMYQVSRRLGVTIVTTENLSYNIVPSYQTLNIPGGR